ncbi:hypothetical protein BLAT2472_80231 [Burkholderia latens]
MSRQFADFVVGQDQPAQRARQRSARHRADPVRLEADHVELRARAEHFRQFGKAIAGCEQDAQPPQPREVVRQSGQRIAGQVQHFERVGQVEDLARKFGQPARELELPGAGQLAGLQLFEGGRHGEKAGSGCDIRPIDPANSTGIDFGFLATVSPPSQTRNVTLELRPLQYRSADVVKLVDTLS